MLRLIIFLAIIVGVVLIQLPNVANALPKDDSFEEPILCPKEARVTASLIQQGLPVVDVEVGVEAPNAKINAIGMVGGVCDATMHPLLSSQTQWSLLTKPASSGADLSGSSTLATTITPDVPGDYTIAFVACATGCTVALSDGTTLPVSEFTRELTFSADHSIAIPPETEPTLPPLPTTLPTPVEDLGPCGFWPDFVSGAWVPIGIWRGADDYRTAEGRTTDSRLASSDNILNHDDMDFLTFLDPDTPYDELRTPSQSDLETEWEYKRYPEVFRPTKGDWMS
ncbi:MAG: hypothetical protein ACE5Q6_25365, partial [Dehalococcoidia bacterium]